MYSVWFRLNILKMSRVKTTTVTEDTRADNEQKVWKCVQQKSINVVSKPENPTKLIVNANRNLENKNNMDQLRIDMDHTVMILLLSLV